MVRDSLRSLVVDSGIFGLKLGILVVFENIKGYKEVFGIHVIGLVHHK